MAEGKTTFILHTDLIHTVEKLSDEEAGKLFKHTLRYVNDQNPVAENMIIDLVFEPIKQTLKRELKKWENTCERNKTNGSKGGRPKKPKKPTGLNKNPKNPSEPKKADSDSDSDSDSVLLEDKSSYTLCMEVYNDFVVRITGYKPIVDKLQGASLKSIISYIEKNCKIQPPKNTDIANWLKHLFDNYDKWSKFHKDNLKLNQIASELLNIINDIKTFKPKQEARD